MKHMPAFFKSSVFSLPVKARLTPSASRQSAAPQREETLLLPCLATATPPDAMTKPDVVEMLKVSAPSPPVPTISKTSPSWETGTHASLMALANPVISPTVSPFSERAARKAPICASDAFPLMISPMDSLAVSNGSSLPFTMVLIASCIMIDSP